METQIDNPVNRGMAGYMCLEYGYVNRKHSKFRLTTQWNPPMRYRNQTRHPKEVHPGIRVKTEEILLLRKHKTYFLNTQSLPYSFQPNIDGMNIHSALFSEYSI
jgi:hypothetical protein